MRSIYVIGDQRMMRAIQLRDEEQWAGAYNVWSRARAQVERVICPTLEVTCARDTV